MTLAITTKISFDAFAGEQALTIYKVESITIETSFKLLTDKAIITLPRNITFFDRNKVKNIFKRGRPVRIAFGYNGNNIDEFQGYVTSASATMPITITCEDEMWKLKQLPVHKSFDSITLKSLLKTVAPNYSINALEGVNLGGLRFANKTVADVLDTLKKTPYNLYSYMDGKTLVCGKYYSDNTSNKTIHFHLERNAVSNQLNYKDADDVVLHIKGVSVLANGTTINAELGDPGGETLQLTYYNISVKTELERLLKKDYELKKRGGFDGSFTAFGIPAIKHGQKVNLTSNLYPDRNGVYYVDAVEKRLENASIRQHITLGGVVL